MSSHGYNTECPKCGGLLRAFVVNKPYDMVGGECLHCGFNYWTESGRLSLEEVNRLREEYEMKPFKKLREQIHEEL